MQGTKISGIQVFPLESVNDIDFDIIMLTTAFQTDNVFTYLKNKGIPQEKIDNYTALYHIRIRNDFLLSQSKIINDKNIPGNIAEGGVYEGYFATKMNMLFPDKKLYLFDTFEGFDYRSLKNDPYSSTYNTEFFNNVLFDNIQFKYPENVIIRKGFFPVTASGIFDDFCFVNLDFDLYQPTLDGLNFFYPKIVKGGIILIHDFFNEDFKGVSKAVNEFCEKNNISYTAIGDSISVLITK